MNGHTYIHTRRRICYCYISSVNRVLYLAKLYSMMVVFKTDMGLMFQKYTSEGCEISEPNVIGLAEDVETA